MSWANEAVHPKEAKMKSKPRNRSSESGADPATADNHHTGDIQGIVGVDCPDCDHPNITEAQHPTRIVPFKCKNCNCEYEAEFYVAPLSEQAPKIRDIECDGCGGTYGFYRKVRVLYRPSERQLQ